MTYTATLLHRFATCATVTAVMTTAAIGPISAQTAHKHKSRAKTANHISSSRIRHLSALEQQSLLRQQMAQIHGKGSTLDKNVIKPGNVTDRGVFKPRKTIDKGMLIGSGGTR